MSAVPVPWPVTVTSFEADADATPPTWRAEFVLDEAAYRLAHARAALAAAVKAQDPDRHFRGLPESPEVIRAYDAVRAAEQAVARLEREGRRS